MKNMLLGTRGDIVMDKDKQSDWVLVAWIIKEQYLKFEDLLREIDLKAEES